MLKVNWFITDQNVTVNYNGQTHIVKRSDALADDLIAAIKDGRLNDVPNLVSVAQAMENKSKGKVVVRDGQLFVKGVAVPAELARKIQNFIDEGLPYQPLIKFAEKLQANPSYRAVNELFQFLEKNNHPFTENGNFIAYKRVLANFKDIYTNSFDNSPGQEPEMPRNQVNENPNETCSRGLHVANWDYAHNQFGSSVRDTDIMLEVEVSPADVVAVPVDYDQAKMRVCKYKVLGVVKSEYTDSHLRITDPNADLAEDPSVEEGFCYECETHTANVVAGVCDDCNENIKVDERYCGDCSVLLTDEEDDLCEDCEELYAEEEEEDRYPWEEELDDDLDEEE